MTTKTVVKPLRDRVLCKREEQEEQLKGGIILPDSAQKKPETAVVIAVGPGKQLDDGKVIPVSLKEGDRIFMDKYAGQEITVDDEEFVIVRADDIIATIE